MYWELTPIGRECIPRLPFRNVPSNISTTVTNKIMGSSFLTGSGAPCETDFLGAQPVASRKISFAF